MAKSIDETKLERIKEATIEMVVSRGYGGASVSSIAKKAQVADGYLYRHYPSKAALVQALYASSIDNFRKLIQGLMDEHKSLEDIIYGFSKALFKMANEEPAKAKFMNMLMNDYTFLMSKEMLTRIPESSTYMLNRGKETGEINSELDIEEFNAIFPAIPIEYASSRVKSVFSEEKLNDNDAHRVARLCIKALS